MSNPSCPRLRKTTFASSRSIMRSTYSNNPGQKDTSSSNKSIHSLPTASAWVFYKIQLPREIVSLAECAERSCPLFVFPAMFGGVFARVGVPVNDVALLCCNHGGKWEGTNIGIKFRASHLGCKHEHGHMTGTGIGPKSHRSYASTWNMAS